MIEAPAIRTSTDTICVADKPVTRAVADDLSGAIFDRGAFPGTLVNSGAAQDRLAHRIRIRRSRHPSALAIKTNTPDAAKIEHGRREDPFVQSAPQDGDQSSLHPDIFVEMQPNLTNSTR